MEKKTENIATSDARREISEAWAELEKQHGEKVIVALRKLYDFYDGSGIARWVANLYDPEIGGFYYCNSARDYETFGPDLESTSQALSLMCAIGAIRNLDEELPNDVKAKLVEFARSLQSPVDGYFYHPQWPQGRENLNTDRYGRDQENAASIIRRLSYDADGDGIPEKKYPKFCTIGGLKCEKHTDTDEVCHFKAAEQPVAQEASKTTVPGGSHPDYSCPEAFLEWLKAYNATIKENSGRAHNLAALINEIISHGYEHILIDYLDKMQEELFCEMEAEGVEPSGIWQRNMDYKAVWGTYKYVHIYNRVGRPVNLKYAPYMVRSSIKVIKLPPIKNYAYNDVMNQWTSITALIQNIRKHYGDAEAEKLYDIVRENPVELIENTLEKMKAFKMEDGSFCNSVKGISTPTIYGVPIALGTMAEGNVNSTHIIKNIYSAIASCLGCKALPLCTREDGEEIVRILKNRKPVVKKKIPTEA